MLSMVATAFCPVMCGSSNFQSTSVRGFWSEPPHPC